MNKKSFRTLVMLFFTCVCMISMMCSAWAAETDGEADTASSGTSRVLTVGTAATESTDTVEVGKEPTADDEVDPAVTNAPLKVYTKGASLGMFTTTGYCNCAKCSGGFSLTYSGTVPQARHTISADLTMFPIGTKLMINDVVYTVEDMGGGVNGNKLDIFYGSHAEAIAHGMRTEEVFAVAE